MKQYQKRLISIITTLTMLAEMAPAIGTAANAAVNEELVKTLAKAYDGDEERSRELLESLHQAGIIDENGNMVQLTIKEDGAAVTLEELSAKIAGNETVGNITVNGRASTAEQIMKLQEAKTALELISMLSEDIEITDEHVSNLESLLQGISDGSIDLNEAIQTGQLSLKSNPSLKKSPALRGTAPPDLPTTSTGSGEVTLTDEENGIYTDKLISGSTYNANYDFQLTDPTNKTYYKDSATEGIVSDGVITLECADTATAGGTVTVTATLDKEQSLPVSFDWAVAAGSIGLTGTTSGTVTWTAGQTGSKTFTVNVAAKGDELWDGNRAFVINVSNLKNVVLSDNATAWSKTVKVTASDKNSIDLWTNVGTLTGATKSGNVDTELSSIISTEEKDLYVKYENNGTVESIPSDSPVRFKLNVSGSFPETKQIYYYKKTNAVKTVNYNGAEASLVLTNPNDSSKTLSFTSDTSAGASSWTKELTGAEVKDYVYNGKSSVSAYIKYNFHATTKIGTFKMTDVSECTTFINALPTITSITLEAMQLAKVTDVTVPAGTYYSGQVVPVTITLDHYATAKSTTTLKVNDVDCPILESDGTISKKFTFGYTVKDVDTGSINVSAISDVDGLDPSSNFNGKSFGTDEGVKLVSAVKQASLDMENIKYGISDADPGDQEVTVLIPFKSGTSVEWVDSESADCTTNGNGFAMKLPTYGNVTISDYLKGAYFSYDNGKTRLPVYVVRQSGAETPVALVTRFAPKANETNYLRLDNLNLFIDTTVGISDATTYIDTWENAKTDDQDFAYFNGTGKPDAPIVVGSGYSYYVKGAVMYEADKYKSRGISNYIGKVENGYLNLGTNNHILLFDEEKPDNQYDVEIVANDNFYKGVMHGVRAEDSEDLTLKPVWSDRKKFTFTKPKDFTWTSSDETIASIEADENGVAHIMRTGKAGEVVFTLTAINGAASRSYDLSSKVKLTVLEGLTPFLNIPEYSQMRTTLTETDTDVPFASNVTIRNSQLDKETTFTVNLYRTAEENGELIKTGEPIWTQAFTSTLENTLTHITIPGSQITEAGTYCVEISAEYFGGDVRDKDTLPLEDLSATAFITVKQHPASVHLNKLDSYYVTAGKIPAIGYTVTKGAEVQYTIQKSGEDVSERMEASNGVIPFNPPRPASLKEAYTITVYARNSAEDDWSVDSMLLTVYNSNFLDQIVKDVTAGEIGGTTDGTGEGVKGKTVEMDNHSKMADYGVDEEGEYQLTFEDFTTLRTDISLQKIVSMNYGEGVWGMLSDKMMWESSDPKTVSVDYKQGGIYSDVRNYSYTSYAPATDFLLVGKDDTGDGEKVTITATHANTGIKSSFDVTTKTLEDQLYVFQFNPAVKTDVVYTNGKGEKRTLQSNDKGELAVYEPNGITEPVMVKSEKDGKTYVGTLFPTDLESGERDIASLQLYPCNNLRLRVISDATLTFLKPDGTPYSGQVTIRGGAYKNGIYCPGALLSVDNNTTKHNGREDIQATVTNGKLNITLDPTQFKHDPNNTAEYGGAQPGDTITYVFEYSFGGSYVPGYVTLNAYTNIEGASSPTDSLIQMRNISGGQTQPQITRQTQQQYYDGEATSYARNVIDYTNNIGISKRFNKAELHTILALPGETVSEDTNGYTTFTSDNLPHFTLLDANNKEFTGQVDNKKTTADQIIDLSDMDSSTLFVFPFSSVPMSRSVYTMTNVNMIKDGLTDLGSNPNTTSSIIKASFSQGGTTFRTETMSFGVSNLSHQRDLSAENGGAKELGNQVEKDLKSQLDMGAIFGDIDVNDMLKQGFVFMSKLSAVAGETPMDMMILPTEDPSVFRIVVSVGYNKREMKTDTNPSIDFDPDHLYDDMESFQKELEKMGKDDKKKDDDDDDGGEGSVHINFYGTIILEAKIGVLGNKWGVDFIGGSVGTNFEAKYGWSQSILVGPVPVTYSLEIKGTADLEVSFANKEEARALLIDAAVGVSVEAFAGLGFDMSIVALKLGIFGTISADDNFLYLTTGNQTGNKLDIAGEIGLKFVAKVAMVEYENTLASTGFNWSKTWGNYDKIKETWEKEGYAEMTGLTTNGRSFKMQLLSNGTALVSIDGGNQTENRNYLKSSPMLRSAPKRGGSADGMTMIQENAYPYSNPVLTDDGSIMLYISDNNNADELQSVVHYAVKEGDSYSDLGAVDTSEDNILADFDVVASGTGSNAFAAWVKQMDSPIKEMEAETSYDDLGMMLNATEIYVSNYNGTAWTTQRLTENSSADMAPTVASSGSNAIVAWRSLTASSMPEEGSAQDLTAMFNVENTINYRIFDSSTNTWKDAQIAYNGSAGTVNAINSAMLPDGTALLVYSVRTTDDITGSETFYTLINPQGDVVTTGRLTNDSYTDTNAQVTTIGDQFIVGWYSEHEAGEEGINGETVVSHDIGLARINANGSVDADFPQSIGGTSASKIGSDFHFSAPINNTDLSDLSIVWSQQKESDKDEDSGKQQLNAVRFYQEDGIIGVTSPTTIAETAKHYTIDSFDTYTDENGEVKAVMIGSDYNTVGDLSVYDTIDLTNLPVQTVNDEGESSDKFAILEKKPTASMKLASGSFAESKIEVTADTNLTDLMPGLTLPVQFTVKNIGTSKLDTLSVQIGTQDSTQFTGMNLLPGQSTVVTVNYDVPENSVQDVDYTLIADRSGTANGTLTLNRPDVGISSMKITSESDKKRDIQLILKNVSDIPLAGSGKTVKLAFYKDFNHTQQIGREITIPASAYQNIDDDIYVYNHSVNVEDFIGDAEEIPDEGVRIYAHTWVDGVDELYTMDNDSSVAFNSLLTKYKSQIIMNSAMITDDEGNYSVKADISNNSLQNAEVGSITADILDSNHNVLASVELTDKKLTLTGEQTKSLTAAVPELTETPASVSLRSSEKSVLLDAGNGSCNTVTITLTTDNKPAGVLPKATKNECRFEGWYTKPKGGEKITNDTILEGGATIYAQYTYIQSLSSQTWTITMDSYVYDGTAHTPTIKGTAYTYPSTEVKYTYYNADTGKELSEAPTKPGNYKVKVYADGGSDYYNRTQWATYSILEPIGENGMADIATFKDNNIIPEVEGKLFAGWFTDSTCTTAYTGDTGKAYAKFIDEKILTVKAQISSGTTANSDSTSIRFITSVDSLKYQNVGFKITFNGKTIDQKMTKVYTTINANGKKISPSVFSADSHYMEAYVLKNIPKTAFGSEFTVTPYFTTQDGTIVDGATNTFTIANMIK